MKKQGHPKNNLATYICNSCKTTFAAVSTVDGSVNVEVCSNCHPFYTGQAGVIVDTYSRVDRFKKQQDAANTDAVVLKKRKKQERNTKVNEIKSGPSVSLRDMLKGNK
jgi:large subunit ribosomal protein L31